jgi:hypothetical protein
MMTLPLVSPAVNLATLENPRDSWPSWTDEYRWETNLDDDPADDDDDDPDEPRPTPGPEFIPSPEDLADAVILLNADVTDCWPDSWPDLMEVCTVSDWDYQAEMAELAERARDDSEGGVL